MLATPPALRPLINVFKFSLRFFTQSSVGLLILCRYCCGFFSVFFLVFVFFLLHHRIEAQTRLCWLIEPQLQPCLLLLLFLFLWLLASSISHSISPTISHSISHFALLILLINHASPTQLWVLLSVGKVVHILIRFLWPGNRSASSWRAETGAAAAHLTQLRKS